MIQLTLETGAVVIFNEQHILAALPNEPNEKITDVFIGELCITVQESPNEILALIQMKFN